jgi:predicted ABC-type ATPase
LADRIDKPVADTPDAPRVERPTADSLRERLEHLPANHPSSPDRTDKQDRTVEPLSDHEYAEHVRDIREKLEKAHAEGLPTERQHTIDTRNVVWARERRIAQKEIVDHLYASTTEVPNEHRAIVAGGLPGAGKSTILDSYLGEDSSRYMKVDPDQIKQEMARRNLIPEVEGLTPMEASDLVHEESSHISKLLAHRAQADGKNLIWDITMSSRESVVTRIDGLRQAGYVQIEGLFIDIPPEVSTARTQARHRSGLEEFRAGKGCGGRFVPPEVTERQADDAWGSVNRKVFEDVKHKLDAWSVYDNSVDGRPPVLVGESKTEKGAQ